MIEACHRRKAYDEATAKGVKVRAMVVINPGNPSGANLDDATLETCVKFAHEKNLVLMADEVYQENVFTSHPFKSLSRVVQQLGLPVMTVSMHSLSKGFLGEAHQPGGSPARRLTSPGPKCSPALEPTTLVLTSPGPHATLMLTNPGPHVMVVG